MKKPVIPRISLAEAVYFAQEAAAVDEARRHLDLSRQLGNKRRMANWNRVISELQQNQRPADAA
jgi:hypothetical protein